MSDLPVNSRVALTEDFVLGWYMNDPETRLQVCLRAGSFFQVVRTHGALVLVVAEGSGERFLVPPRLLRVDNPTQPTSPLFLRQAP